MAKEKPFNLSEKRKELYKQLWIDLQEGNLTLRQIIDDFIEVNNDLDKEFIKRLKEEIELRSPDFQATGWIHNAIDKLAGDKLI